MSDDASALVERLRAFVANEPQWAIVNRDLIGETADLIESLQAERDRYAALLDDLPAGDKEHTTTGLYDIIARAKELRE